MERVFQKAEPVWESGEEQKMNEQLSFRIIAERAENMRFLTATSGEYQLFVNGRLAAAGPAKAARGFFKADDILLDPFMKDGKNVIVLDVLYAGINSFSLQDQDPFVQAELRCSETCMAWTGQDGNLSAWHRESRIRRVQRYSYQRTFSEAFRYSADEALFYTCEDPKLSAVCRGKNPCRLMKTEEKRIFLRDVPYPQYPDADALRLVGCGKVDFEKSCSNPMRDRSYVNISERLRGFTIEELEEHLSDEAQGFGFIPGPLPLKTEKTGVFGEGIGLEDGYLLAEMAFDMTGFIRLSVSCAEACVLYVLFDEILTDGDVDFVRLGTCNCLKYYLEPGDYSLLSFQPYTLKYMKIAVKGKALIKGAGMIQFKHEPVSRRVKLPEGDQQLLSIAQAAEESFLANAVDMFFDCPSRERGGWLCDSFFTSRVEWVLTGKSVLERAFLNNFIIAESFPFLPEGMLPMCYPSDHDNREFIPNWAMWFVLELEEYYGRTNDRELVERARGRVFDFLRYLEGFENRDGLLEHLDGWVFVEWSKANDWVQDINFPSNMMYARILQSVSVLYQEPSFAQKSERLKRLIRQRSYDGQFFTDHELTGDGENRNPGDKSEVCQYYAFFTGIASKEEYPQLWERLVKDFGPDRPKQVYADVAEANAFVGDYLRLELLYLDGQYEKVLADMRGYFAPMAEKTGTLWEHNRPEASCCHGFASHVLYWLARIYGTEEKEQK